MDWQGVIRRHDWEYGSVDLQTIEKTVDEDVTFGMQFDGDLPSGVTISTITAITIVLYTGSGTATEAGSAISGTKVESTYSGGVSGSVYYVKVEIVASNGDNMEGHGLLKVQDVVIP